MGQASPGAPAPAAKKGVRYGFIDLLRGLALVVMIETHVVNAYLTGDMRQQPFFFWLTFVNGLVAPTFLFASGFSIMLQGKRHWENWLRFRLPFWQQMRRLGFIMLVAYYSHLDNFKLSKYLHPDDPAVWRNALQVDILQCIVASLLIVHLLALVFRRPDRLAPGAISIAIGIALLTPLIWARDFTQSLPLGIALFLNPHGISLFPLFPWIVFILAGTAAAIYFLRCAERGADGRLMGWAFPAGIILIAAGLMGRSLPMTLPGRNHFYTTSPLYVMIRLGFVFVVCASLYFLEKNWSFRPGQLIVAGQESLLVYGVHLWMIFAVLRGKHVGPILGLEAGYAGCFALSLALIALLLWLARLYHKLKTTYPSWTRRGQAVTVLIMIVVFLSR